MKFIPSDPLNIYLLNRTYILYQVRELYSSFIAEYPTGRIAKKDFSAFMQKVSMYIVHCST